MPAFLHKPLQPNIGSRADAASGKLLHRNRLQAEPFDA
jgi:hypothetical protein